MAAETVQHGIDLLPVVALLAAAVIAVPLFRRFGLDSVLAYLAAGLVIGPYGIALFTDPQTILNVAELGVVMFLFLIGLGMQPSRLWGLRKDIVGLGFLQVGLSGAVLTGLGVTMGFSPPVAFVFGMGFTLTSTAVVVQILNERGELGLPKAQRMISIMLVEDLSIVPLLAFVAFIAPGGEDVTAGERWLAVAIAFGALVALILVGRFLLNPMFRILARTGAREVLTAAALLVVLGAAFAMESGGLSMAMGAFLAGVLLSESTFRHQLEADIEPFRGILLGLFFLGVGMSLDVNTIATNAGLVALAVIGFMAGKAIVIYAVARLLRSPHSEALERAGLMAQGGEFAFVLYAAAAATGLIDGPTNAIFTSTVIISMVLTPFVMMAVRRLIKPPVASTDGVETPGGLNGNLLIIGFGRFGQIASQPLLMRGCDVSIIDNDVEMIEAAGSFGFKVYFGDGTRLDILHAAGAGSARAVLVCVDDAEQAERIVRQMKGEFPLVPVLARAYDRGAAIRLIEAGATYQIRETLESAMAFGAAALAELGVSPEEADDLMAEVRRRDSERLELQISGGMYAGTDLLKGNAPTPAPLATPTRQARPGNDEAASALAARRSSAPDD